MSDQADPIPHTAVLAAGLPWAQDGWKTRVWTAGTECWGYDPRLPKPIAWRPCTIVSQADFYVTFGLADGRDFTTYRANVRDDLGALRFV